MSALTQHWQLKLLALAFATALWLFVMTSEKSDIVVSAPIQVDGLPFGIVITGEQPESVDVELHGLRGSLARLAPDQLKARLSLAGASPGEVTVRLLPEHVSVPPGITVLRINPSRIRLVLGAPAPAPPTPREYTKGSPRP